VERYRHSIPHRFYRARLSQEPRLLYLDRVRTTSRDVLQKSKRARTETRNGAPNMPLIPDTAVFQRKLGDLPIATYQAGETVLTATCRRGPPFTYGPYGGSGPTLAGVRDGRLRARQFTAPGENFETCHSR
jgi:hypothetical protein